MFKLTLWNYTCVMAGPTSPLLSLLCVVGSCMCAVNDAKCSLMRTADAKRFEDGRGDSVALWLFIKSYWLWTAVWTQTAQASKTEWNQRGGGGGVWLKHERWKEWAVSKTEKVSHLFMNSYLSLSQLSVQPMGCFSSLMLSLLFKDFVNKPVPTNVV